MTHVRIGVKYLLVRLEFRQSLEGVSGIEGALFEYGSGLPNDFPYLYFTPKPDVN